MTKSTTEDTPHTFIEQSFGALCKIPICAGGGLMGFLLAFIVCFIYIPGNFYPQKLNDTHILPHSFVYAIDKATMICSGSMYSPQRGCALALLAIKPSKNKALRGQQKLQFSRT